MHNIDGIILAAGLSKRMGVFKPLLPFGEKTIIETAIDAMSEATDIIYIIGGHKIERLYEALQEYENIEIVENESFHDGMFSSVRTGLRHIEADRFFLTPCDYPLVDKNVYNRLAQAEGEVILPVHDGRSGHPVLIDSKFIKQILAMPKSATLRDFIYNVKSKRVEVGTDAIYKDADYMEDYHKLISGKAKDGKK